jgi:hypothetical protein
MSDDYTGDKSAVDTPRDTFVTVDDVSATNTGYLYLCLMSSCSVDTSHSGTIDVLHMALA